MKHLLEQLSNAVDNYNERTGAENQLDYYEVLDSLNNNSEEEIKQAIAELE